MDPSAWFVDEGVVRALSLIATLVSLGLGVVALYRLWAGAPHRYTLLLLAPLLALALASSILAGSFYARSGQSSFKFRLTQSDDIAVARGMFKCEDVLKTQNAALRVTVTRTSLFFLGDDAYRVSEFTGSVLPSTNNLTYSFIGGGGSGSRPMELFIDKASKDFLIAKDGPPCQQAAKSNSLSLIQLPRRDFDFLSIVRYPGAVDRRSTPDYVFFGLFYVGGIERSDYAFLFDGDVRHGETGLFRVQNNWWGPSLYEIPVYRPCTKEHGPDSALRSEGTWLQKGVADPYPATRAYLQPVLAAFGTDTFRTRCSFSLGPAPGVLAFAFVRQK